MKGWRWVLSPEDRISERMPDCHVTIFPGDFWGPWFFFRAQHYGTAATSRIMVDVEASVSRSTNPYSGGDTSVLPLCHPINVLWRLLYMTISLWGVHHFRVLAKILHDPKIRHEVCNQSSRGFCCFWINSFVVVTPVAQNWLGSDSRWVDSSSVLQWSASESQNPPHILSPYCFATTAILFIKAYVEMYAGKMQKKKVTCKEIMAIILSTKWTMWILLTSHDFLHLLQTRTSSRQHTSLWFYSSWRLYLFIWRFGPSLGQVPSSLWFWSGCLFLIFAFWCQLQCKTWPPLHCWPFSCKNTHSIHHWTSRRAPSLLPIGPIYQVCVPNCFAWSCDVRFSRRVRSNES